VEIAMRAKNNNRPLRRKKSAERERDEKVDLMDEADDFIYYITQCANQLNSALKYLFQPGAGL